VLFNFAVFSVVAQPSALELIKCGGVDSETNGGTTTGAGRSSFQ